MIFGRIPDEQRQANAEHAAETVLYRENVELREQTRDLEKQLSIVESFSDAEAELFGLFNEYLHSVAYLTLSSEAKATWHPVFKEALAQLLGDDAHDEIDRIIDTSTFGALLEHMATASPSVQATIDMLADEVLHKAQAETEEQVIRRQVAKAENDAILQAPARAEEMYQSFQSTPEGRRIYNEALQRKLGELATAEPGEIARRLQHQAYLDAEQSHLDQEARKLAHVVMLERARESFSTKGIDLRELPVGTEVTIWLGTEKQHEDFRRQILEAQRNGYDDDDSEWVAGLLVHSRKLKAVTTNDAFGGLDIHEDFIDAAPDSGQVVEERPYNLGRYLEALSDFDPGRTVLASGDRKKKAPKVDDVTSLEGRHVLGLSRKGYANERQRLEQLIVAGKPLAFDGDPRNPEHKSTSTVVVNVALDGEQVIEFEQEVTQSQRRRQMPEELKEWLRGVDRPVQGNERLVSIGGKMFVVQDEGVNRDEDDHGRRRRYRW